MKTILVPVDFSATAKNAAHYALDVAAQLHASKIILYNAYQAPVITEPTMPVMQMMDVETLKNISSDGMKQFRTSLNLGSTNIEVEEVSEFAVLPNAIGEVCERTGAELIIMGTDDASKFEEVLIGSTAISVVKHTKVPVIIIPPHATPKPMRTILWACDYKKVEETTPIAHIKDLLTETGAQLFVLNINEKHSLSDNDRNKYEGMIKIMMNEFEPQFHYVDNDDFIGAINQFTEANNIDLIISIPKKHGMFDNLFRESHTKQLAFHSHVPLMYMHHEEL